MKKDFSVLKWLIFPLLILGFAIGIAYNSTEIFGVKGSIAYYLILLAIFAISLVMILHTSKHQTESGVKQILPSTKAAFGFECALMLALGVTLVCSIYVAREMAGNKQAAAADVQMIEAVGKLKSSKAQANATKNLKQTGDIAAAFASAESLMFWPLVFELGLALAGLMTVFGIVLFVNDRYARQSPVQSPVQSPGQSAQFAGQSASVRQAVTQGALRVGTSTALGTVTNGNGFTFSFSQSGQGQSLRFRERGSNAKHVVYVTSPDAVKLSQLDYEALAAEAIKRRRERHGEDEMVRRMQQTV